MLVMFTVFATLARLDNRYWADFFLPWLPVGLALFPRFCLRALGFDALRALPGS